MKRPPQHATHRQWRRTRRAAELAPLLVIGPVVFALSAAALLGVVLAGEWIGGLA